MLKRVCVYCGSNKGQNPAYGAAAQALGRLLAERGIGLVYGGGSVGLMGMVADAALAAGGEVIGVIPTRLLEKEVDHRGLSQLIVTETMHQRKARMAELSDGFIAMPGGIGTLEELFEVWTWTQLGYQGKPVGLLNVDGFYDSLIQFLDQLVQQGFLRAAHREILRVSGCPETLLGALSAFRPIAETKWTDLSAT